MRETWGFPSADESGQGQRSAAEWLEAVYRRGVEVARLDLVEPRVIEDGSQSRYELLDREGLKGVVIRGQVF